MEYCSLQKPIIVLNGGRHEGTNSAITSHMGWIAGSYDSYKTSFQKSFLIEASSEVEFLDSLKATSMLPKAKGRRALIISHAGGMGLIAAIYASPTDFACPKQSLVYPRS